MHVWHMGMRFGTCLAPWYAVWHVIIYTLMPGGARGPVAANGAWSRGDRCAAPCCTEPVHCRPNDWALVSSGPGRSGKQLCGGAPRRGAAPLQQQGARRQGAHSMRGSHIAGAGTVGRERPSAARPARCCETHAAANMDARRMNRWQHVCCPQAAAAPQGAPLTTNPKLQPPAVRAPPWQ